MSSENTNSTDFPIPTPVRSDDFRVLYANTIKTEYSFNDIQITLGVILGDGPGKFIVRELAAVNIPYAQAKILKNTLSSILDCYEKVAHKIVIPKGQDEDTLKALMLPMMQNFMDKFES